MNCTWFLPSALDTLVATATSCSTGCALSFFFLVYLNVHISVLLLSLFSSFISFGLTVISLCSSLASIYRFHLKNQTLLCLPKPAWCWRGARWQLQLAACCWHAWLPGSCLRRLRQRRRLTITRSCWRRRLHHRRRRDFRLTPSWLVPALSATLIAAPVTAREYAVATESYLKRDIFAADLK